MKKMGKSTKIKTPQLPKPHGRNNGDAQFSNNKEDPRNSGSSSNTKKTLNKAQFLKDAKQKSSEAFLPSTNDPQDPWSEHVDWDSTDDPTEGEDDQPVYAGKHHYKKGKKLGPLHLDSDEATSDSTVTNEDEHNDVAEAPQRLTKQSSSTYANRDGDEAPTRKTSQITNDIHVNETAFYKALMNAQSEGAKSATCAELMKAFQEVKTLLFDFALQKEALTAQLQLLKDSTHQHSGKPTYSQVVGKHHPAEGTRTIDTERESSILLSSTDEALTPKQIMETITNNIDPATFKLTNAQIKTQGPRVRITSTNKKAMEDIQAEIKRLPEASKIEIQVASPKKPSFKIVGIDQGMEKQDIPQKIMAQNQLTGSPSDIEVTTQYVNRKKNNITVIKTTANIWKQLRNKDSLNIGWLKVALYDNNHPVICRFCARFGHPEKYCRSSVRCCIYCARNHPPEQCRSEEQFCPACHREGKEDYSHSMEDNECPTAKEWRSRLESQWDSC